MSDELDPRLDTPAGLREIGRAKELSLLGAVMLRATRDAPEAVAIAAAECLTDLEDPRAELALVGLLRHRHTNARIAAAKALGETGSPKCLSALARARPRTAYNRTLGTLQKTIDTAVDLVKVRSSTVGQLSLHADSGALSKADASGGLSDPSELRGHPRRREL
ncbi:MAG: HEAT repeat domain-containing protein [Deltaproteobacteria bacterium]|nr:HEAT repeat domain-containing protein [Deltaproteobacteria bacterium]